MSNEPDVIREALEAVRTWDGLFDSLPHSVAAKINAAFQAVAAHDARPKATDLRQKIEAMVEKLKAQLDTAAHNGMACFPEHAFLKDLEALLKDASPAGEGEDWPQKVINCWNYNWCGWDYGRLVELRELAMATPPRGLNPSPPIQAAGVGRDDHPFDAEIAAFELMKPALLATHDPKTWVVVAHGALVFTHREFSACAQFAADHYPDGTCGAETPAGPLIRQIEEERAFIPLISVAASAPPGWKLMPMVATPEMIAASETALADWRKTLDRDEAMMRSYRPPHGSRQFIASATPGEKHAIRYAAMVAVAPQPDQSPSPENQFTKPSGRNNPVEPGWSEGPPSLTGDSPVDGGPTPFPALDVSGGKQPFERYPALASWIERMANTSMDLSLGDWMVFVGALNQAILKAERASSPSQVAAPAGWRPDLIQLRSLLRAVGDFLEYETENRNGAGALMSDYEDEPKQLFDRVDAYLATLPESGEGVDLEGVISRIRKLSDPSHRPEDAPYNLETIHEITAALSQPDPSKGGENGAA